MLARAQVGHFGGVGRPFGAAVPGALVAAPSATVLAMGNRIMGMHKRHA